MIKKEKFLPHNLKMDFYYNMNGEKPQIPNHLNMIGAKKL